MTPEEKFIFDLDGYIVIKDVLTRDEVDEINAVTDEKQRQKDSGEEVGKPSTWGPVFRDMLDHPKTLPYMIELLGN